MLHQGDLPYVLELIETKLISRHYNESLAGHFRIKKMRELIARKYQQNMLRQNVKIYFKKCDIYLAIKAMRETNHIETYNHCQYSAIAKKIYGWILLQIHNLDQLEKKDL